VSFFKSTKAVFSYLLIAVAVLLAVTSLAFAAGLNKCIAPDGSVAFTDQPCPANNTKTEIANTRLEPATSASSQIKALRQAITEIDINRAAARADFEARSNTLETPECRELMTKMSSGKLSLTEGKVVNDNYNRIGCAATLKSLSENYWKADEEMVKKAHSVVEEIKKIHATVPRYTLRTPECKNLANQEAALTVDGMSGAASTAQIRKLEQVTEKSEDQKCDKNLFEEAMERHFPELKIRHEEANKRIKNIAK
jgi:Domain of unknown function (DUF4124)